MKIQPLDKLNDGIRKVKLNIGNCIDAIDEVNAYYNNYPDKVNTAIRQKLIELETLKAELAHHVNAIHLHN